MGKEMGQVRRGQAVVQRPEWPAWLEGRRIEDGLCADAYEAAGPGARAAVKTAIAMFLKYSGSSAEVVHEERTDRLAGFWRSRTVFPAPWALVAFTPNYAAAARMLGAVMPAVCAGVSLIGCACIGGAPAGPVLAALELAGIEDIFTLTEAEASALLEETQPGPGRLVLLHSGRLDTLRQQAGALHVPVFEERRPPSITITRPELFDLEVLRFAQGRQPVQTALESPAPDVPDVLYSSPESVKSHCLAGARAQFSLGMAPLALAPGCEAFWLHHGLGRSFFLTHRVGFGLREER